MLPNKINTPLKPLKIATLCIAINQLLGCATYVDSPPRDLYYSDYRRPNVVSSYDEYLGVTVVKGPEYKQAIQVGYTGNFKEARISFLRGFVRNGEVVEMQLYITYLDSDWLFIHTARDDEAQDLGLQEVTRIVKDGIEEHVYVPMDVDYLRHHIMRNKPIKLRLLGKNGQADIAYPVDAAIRFLERISQYE